MFSSFFKSQTSVLKKLVSFKQNSYHRAVNFLFQFIFSVLDSDCYKYKAYIYTYVS